MKNYKAIILGPQCSGKTTLKNYLEKKYSLPLLEEDELFTDLNKGEYPHDIKHKEKTLRPLLEEHIRQSKNIVFLTSYCDRKFLNEVIRKGFKVIQLVLEMDEFSRRNVKRMKEQGCDDARIWANDIFSFHKEIREKGLVDKSIDATLKTEEIAQQIVTYLD